MWHLAVLVIFVVYIISEYIKNVRHGRKLAKYFKELPYKPIIGSLYLFPRDVPGIFQTIMGFHKKYGQSIIARGLLNRPALQTSNPIIIEKILLSKTVKKSIIYSFFSDWLGTGLLMSSGGKWLTRRRILTPAFHFKILDGFLDIFQENEEKLVKKIQMFVEKDEFEIFHFVSLMALDSICETSMGVKINALDDPENEYVKAAKSQKEVLFKRIFSLLSYYKKLFPLTDLYWQQKKNLKILHGFSNRVIQERRQFLESRKPDLQQNTGEDEDVLYIKKRLSFLDLLLNVKETGTILTDKDIRDEVDTFIVAGHDTTTSTLSFTIHQLSQNQDIQEQVYHEILTFVGEKPKTAPLSSKMLNDLKYMDMVIKETMRLYTTIPTIGRDTTEDTYVGNNIIIPAGTEVNMCLFALHRDENLYPDPLKFDPERFSDESQAKRKPYDFIPFSAGPRNCIGQKFAMLEMKSALVKLLANYKILPGTTKLEYHCDVALTPTNGIFIKIVDRM